MRDIARLRDLVRWMLRPSGCSIQRDETPPDGARSGEPSKAPETPEEFENKISQHDREMATIAEIVAAVRQERPPPSASR